MGSARRRWGVALSLCAMALASASCSSGSHTAAPPASGPLPVVDWNCYSPGRVRPAQILLACGDGNAIAVRLAWSSWSDSAASGAGFLRQNDCTPDCARGTFHDFAARFHLSDVVRTSGRTYFTQVTITFDAKSPVGRKTETVKDCFDNPPDPSIPRCPAKLLGA